MSSTLHHYYSVTRVNEEDTTVVPGNSFNFEIKVMYHSADTFPDGLQHQLLPASILSQDFFQEGSIFLQTVLTLSPFAVGCPEEIAEGIVSNVQAMFSVNSASEFLALESSQESPQRVIPLTVAIIILNYGDQAASEEYMETSRRNQRVIYRRSPRLSARARQQQSSRMTQQSSRVTQQSSRMTQQSSRMTQQSSRVSQRPSSRVNQRQNSAVTHTSEEEAIINTFLKKCTVIRGREDCCICLEALSNNAECYTMPCEHAFHLPCILTWLKTSHMCPLCRFSVSTAGENLATEGENLPAAAENLPTTAAEN
ncbi:hypothetical protein PHAVU_006G017800 [Phaseolus vulgaris]|uniref:RING-type domain-containing protein n=1 Tax=Phaseolus vulgaris TaxID=3885 RepID=V7BMB6_PHAVU|nr:hypothetical protein PHAVU_006G017800g [Phaseolus vulgaris]ESW18158.1 hypothetical protein PHAVU_006G017800g [Phaseolus vulgaris]